MTAPAAAATSSARRGELSCAGASAESAVMRSPVFIRCPPDRARRASSDRDGRRRAPRPSLMPSFAAVSRMLSPSSEMAETTLCWRPSRCPTSLASSPCELSGAGGMSGSTSIRPSMGTSPRRPLRRHHIDQLVARDRVQPWQEGLILHPGLTLQMDRQQNLLHHIFGLGIADAGPRKPIGREFAQPRRDRFQKPAVGRAVARKACPHQLRPRRFGRSGYAVRFVRLRHGFRYGGARQREFRRS